MELDMVDAVSKVGFPIVVSLFLLIILWKLIPTINGLKTVITELKGIVTTDASNTGTMASSISALTIEIARMNKNGKK